jgi:putative ABC transport system permease protein
MTPRRIITQSLRYYALPHLAVLACVAVAASVLAGALIVGDSMRGSLRDLTLDRLGRIDFALASPRIFAGDLAERVRTGVCAIFGDGWDDPNFVVSPALILNGTVARVDDANQESARAGRVQVCGVSSEFWSLGRSHQPPKWASSWGTETALESVTLNDALAAEIGAAVGDTVIVRIEKPSEIPREAVLGRKDDQIVTRRLRVSRVVGPSELGHFKLDSGQRVARSIFLPRQSLAEAVGHAGRANTLLATSARGMQRIPQAATPDEIDQAVQLLQRSLSEHWKLDDLGVRLRPDAPQNAVSLESRRMILESPVSTAAREAARALNASASPVMTYLANSIRLVDPSGETHTIPYSIVAALGDTGDAIPPFQFRDGNAPAEFRDGDILLNTWAADDLGCRVGDKVRLEYYVAEPARPFETAEAEFRVAGIVEIEGIADDPGLVPEYPGITNAKRYSDWDPPFPMDLKRVRPKDEEYWDKYRTTPKAFVSPATATKLWASRFGEWTSVRFSVPDQPAAPAPDPSPFAAWRRMCEEQIVTRLDPKLFGLSFQPVKAQGLAAATGGTDFGGLFIAFSFFLIAAAAILVALVFRLNVERRGRQVGLLLAVGFDRASVRKLLMVEGLIVAVLGTAIGLIGAVGYAWLVILALRTWWLPAVGTTMLAIHVTATSLAIGAIAGLLVAALAIAVSLRGLTSLSPRALLSGTVAQWRGGAARSGSGIKFRLVAGAAVVALICGSLVWGSESPAAFFVVGAIVLVTLLSIVVGPSGAAHRPVVGGGLSAIVRLGVRNVTRHRGRSILTIGLVAFATFVIVAVGANRQGESVGESSQSGASWLVAESSVPLLHDLNSVEGRRELAIPDDVGARLEGVTVHRFRLKPGEDASCLNLYQPRTPHILGATDEAIGNLHFPLATSRSGALAQAPADWGILNTELGGDAIPAIGDANSVKWILHLGLDQSLPIRAEDGRTMQLKIVGLLDHSVFQSELVISESNFRKLFPSQAGYSYFLIEPPRDVGTAGRSPSAMGELSALLEKQLSDFGFDAELVSHRIAEYHAVENTYLETFQMLGGLGLILGTLGLGAVVLRGVLERRGELALLLAVGFRPSKLAWLVVAETAYLLLAGVFVGGVSALTAVAPHVLAHATQVPWPSLAGTVAWVLVAGLISSGAAVLATLRTPLLPALRSE